MAISRRSTLRRLATLPGLLVLGTAARLARADTRRAQLLAGFSNLGSARRIGRLYLEAHPGEADADWLVARIDAGIGNARGRREIRRAVRQAVRDDMRAGRSVMVDGWVLARTEARLCALACVAES